MSEGFGLNKSNVPLGKRMEGLGRAKVRLGKALEGLGRDFLVFQ